MAKKDLRVRVRYNRGVEGCGPDEGKALDTESFVLELWDEEYKSWGVSTIAPLRRCVEYPDAKEREFINYQFMMELFKLQRLGYSVSLSKAEEAMQ